MRILNKKKHRGCNGSFFVVSAQPHLIAKSPTQVFALPGDQISLSVELERGLQTIWSYDAQVIPEIPDDPDMAFQRTLKKNKILETLVFSSVDWRHFGIYLVETHKGGCQGTVAFHLHQDQGERVVCLKYFSYFIVEFWRRTASDSNV